MTTRPRLFEDRPRELAELAREEMEKTWQNVQAARKFFWCEECGAEKGEPCVPRDALLKPWYKKWSAHARRVARWMNATELERAMLEAADG